MLSCSELQASSPVRCGTLAKCSLLDRHATPLRQCPSILLQGLRRRSCWRQGGCWRSTCTGPRNRPGSPATPSSAVRAAVTIPAASRNLFCATQPCFACLLSRLVSGKLDTRQKPQSAPTRIRRMVHDVCCAAPADGNLYMATPMDPAFVLLPLLEAAAAQVRHAFRSQTLVCIHVMRDSPRV